LFLEKGRPGSHTDTGLPARRAGVTGESAKKKLLVLSGLSAGYNGKMICKDVDLAIAAGEIVTITGENGCGKSTLLRAILGLCRLYGGEIGFNDEAVHNLLPEERVKKGISYVFQDKRIFSRMTVEENLKVAYSGPKGSRTLRLNRVHDIFPVLKKKARLPGGLLSGGEQQMLAVARVLMQDPRLILLDEPFSGLSENFVDVLLDQIRRLADSGIAILIIEHRIDKAAGITDRLFAFKNGKLD
jgi:branched-chain amino acid transport system ATP-binding protein